MRRAAGSEREFIESLKRRFGRLAPAPPAGIGDDAARLAGGPDHLFLSADALIEGRHFLRGEPPFLLGRKALAVNLSDLAAMGAAPAGFLLTIGVPRGLPPAWLERLFDGMASMAAAHRCPLLGGDTSAADSLILSIAVVGTGRRGLPRSGARSGEILHVSGGLGTSAAGRALLSAGWRPRLSRGGERVTGALPPKGAPASPALRAAAALALAAHLDPAPRLGLGQTLLDRRLATAAIDLSDGLSIDLHRLADASGAGARLWTHALPVSDAARTIGPALGIDPRSFALDGGEDYELLFTAPAAGARALGTLGALPIGRIAGRRAGVAFEEPDGRTTPLVPGGFDHLRSRGPARRARR